MKKTYIKPGLKNTKLLCNASLLAASDSKSTYTNIKANGSESFSNQESEHDIWGNSGNSIW